jgi:hypothetical protein
MRSRILGSRVVISVGSAPAQIASKLRRPRNRIAANGRRKEVEENEVMQISGFNDREMEVENDGLFRGVVGTNTAKYGTVHRFRNPAL